MPDNFKIATVKRPDIKRYGPFLGCLLHIRTPANSLAGIVLREMHNQPWQGMRALEDDWQFPAPLLPADVRFRVFQDGTILLGQAIDRGTAWHPVVFTAQNPILEVRNPNVGEVRRTLTWKPNPHTRLEPKKGPTALMNAWPEAISEAITLWARHLGSPQPVAHPHTSTEGVFSPAAPFIGPTEEICAATQRALEAALVLCPENTPQSASIYASTVGNTSRINPADFVAAIHHKHFFPKWIKEITQHPNWPAQGIAALTPVDVSVRPTYKKKSGPPLIASAKAPRDISAHTRLNAMQTFHELGLPLPSHR